MEQGVQALAVGLGLVEEHPELRRGPHHDGTGLFARLPPSLYPVLGPQLWLRPLAGLQLDVGGRVEDDELTSDGRIQGGAQRPTDGLAGGWPVRLAVRLHLGELRPLCCQRGPLRSFRCARLAWPAPCFLLPSCGVLSFDHLIVVGDRIEHLLNVADVQSVEPDVPDAGL
ncbi:hypothetical protein [Streptomyces sp. NBC_00878]|uniref:hypothetical protein n=1 Tax=Streptomyces sp. NBC_00878 TaxID=2975854 RepID=UPI002255CBB4|nr:hypothetical protein [Streptomyces sp. NBC_00878]MCX4906872.1 hypothetical protein [Streptomyces sp. NBC_00878]